MTRAEIASVNARASRLVAAVCLHDGGRRRWDYRGGGGVMGWGGGIRCLLSHAGVRLIDAPTDVLFRVPAV